MKVINKSQHATLEAATYLSYAEIGHGIAVFRLNSSLSSEEVVPGLLKHHVFDRQSEGFAKMTAIRAYISGKSSELGDSNIALAADGLLPNIARLGFIAGYEATHGGKETTLVACHVAAPYAAIVENGVSVDQVFRPDNSSHMAFTLDGTPLPVGIYHDYMRGMITNGRYDLPKALEILKANPQVRFADGHGHLTNTKEIEKVPYYNTERNCSSFLRFIYEPSPEEAIALWTKQQSYDQQYPSTQIFRAMFDLDVLGLRAGGAAYFEDFYKDRRSDEESDRDD